jgi:hypothetical protein
MTQEQLTDKFMQCARLARKPLTQETIENLTECVLKLDKHDTLDKDFFLKLQS